MDQTACSELTVTVEEMRLVHELTKDLSGARVLLDVGAQYGVLSRPFLDDDWAVYAFEPNPVSRERLLKLTEIYPKLSVDARAVWDKTESDRPFYTSQVSAGISGLHAFHPSHKESGKADTVSLAQFCGEKSVQQVDVLKTDTEGSDLFVLKGFPWDRMKPAVVICEFEDNKTTPLGYSFHDLAGFLVQQGYDLLVSEWYPIETYGQLHNWRRFITYPCELSDGNAWGNIIAFRDGIDWPKLQTCTVRWIGAELQRSQKRVKAMHDSRSWKITAPLRKAMGLWHSAWRSVRWLCR
jgi:FkbM family methyltransferase